MITNFRGHNLKVQQRTFFDLKRLACNSPGSLLWPQWLKNSSTIFFLKIASNQCKSSKYWWEVWMLGRGRKKLNVLSSEDWYNGVYMRWPFMFWNQLMANHYVHHCTVDTFDCLIQENILKSKLYHVCHVQFYNQEEMSNHYTF